MESAAIVAEKYASYCAPHADDGWVDNYGPWRSCDQAEVDRNQHTSDQSIQIEKQRFY